MPPKQPRGFLVMGVSGSGKTALGKALAAKLRWYFFDADDFHPPENISKMANGIPLGDSDRAPWLASLHEQLLSTLGSHRHPVLACSALKESYRTQLLDGIDNVAIIYLKGSYDVIWSRMSMRKGHYMKPEMLESQFNALQEPQDAYIADVSMSVTEIAASILQACFQKEDWS